MILNNYWKLKHAIDTGVFHSETGWDIRDIGLKDMSGTAFNTVVATASGYDQYAFANLQLKTNLGGRVGTGETAPTLTDYALATDATSSFTNFSATANTTYSDGRELTTVTFTGSNNTGSAITIKEVGLYKAIYRDGVASSYNNVLLVRDVLSTPITVAAGDGFSFTFNWEEGVSASATRNILSLSKGSSEPQEETKVEEEVKQPVEEEKAEIEPSEEPVAEEEEEQNEAER